VVKVTPKHIRPPTPIPSADVKKIIHAFVPNIGKTRMVCQ
jgi:hypothetical protein